ncbi:M48 family metallopeptidase [Blastomonas sp.]|uniref:M48 family metallopeptidase n=1 Tax=Blastomonas sp. TaxID=1909299 RepID=UPI00262EA647|nr:M48 family metallopeptidase [Blastomonas sp.]MDM7954951.1 M48 family metallopeptidase [Blastomonas sp.]
MRIYQRWALTLALGMAAIGSVLPAAANPAAGQSAAFNDLRASDVRVLSVGYRLATANAPFCRSTENAGGLTLHHIGQYPDAAAAKSSFGFARDYAVLALVGDGPAARAGVRADDAVVALNGAPFGAAPAELEAIDQPEAYRPVAWADAKLRSELSAGPVTLTVLRDGQTIDFTLTGTPACRSRFELRPSGDYGASADGDIVGITVPMLDFMVDDDELAAILAHEMAHNLLEHRKRLNEAGVQRGLLQQIGRSARLTLATEIEADRLSIWLMANAGYDPGGAVRFWTRYGKQRGKGIFSAPTHYRWKKRVGLFEAEMAKLVAAARDPRGWYPPLLAAPVVPLK